MNVRKIGLIAARDFVATISNRGFVIGLLVMPAMLLIFAVLGPRIANARSPQVRGALVVIDRTGQVAGELKKALDPAAITRRRTEAARRTIAAAAPGVDQTAVSDAAIERAVGSVPALQVVVRPADADIAREKDWLIADQPGDRHLAVVVVQADATVKASGAGDYGGYELYEAPTLDESTESAIHESMQHALVAARLAAGRFDQTAIEAMTNVRRPQPTIVAAKGEQQAQRGVTRVLPLILGVLLFMGVMLGGQTLMTSTIEEKSSRVIEVLLAAASPLELMAGKLIGQLGTGLLVLSVYVGLGFFALYSFASAGLVDPILVAYLLAFFIITYLIFGTFMMWIGAAVDQIADAQALMGPVIVPAWQPLLTMGIGLAAAAGAVWFSAKVFKIGLLMHGKPPDFATLVRWARMA